MADQKELDSASSEAEGRMIIRRFTNELSGDTPLERSTQAAQLEADEEIEASENMRLKRLYDNPEGRNSTFDIVEVARTELARSCEKFSAETKTSAVATAFGRSRISAKAKANAMLQDWTNRDFNDVAAMVSNLGMEWKSSHGKVYASFETICKTLDAHRSIFAVFPSQNMYVSVFCGSLSLLLQAAVNHSNIAETLSQSVADISSKAATCAQILYAITTESMRRRLADIFAEVFKFFRDVMEWYLSSRTSRFLGSFNDSVKKGFEAAVDAIKDHIAEMYREGAIGGLAMLRDVEHRISLLGSDVSDIKSELIRQRQNYRPDIDIPSGKRMFELLLAIYQQMKDQNRSRRQVEGSTEFVQVTQFLEATPHAITSRNEAQNHSKHLGDFIVGDDGTTLLGSGPFLLAEDIVLSKLQEWMTGNKNSRVLWLSSPFESEAVSSAKAAALGVVASAWEAEVPFISHFCERPRRGRGPASQTTEETGLIGLVYSLIRQLLQFNIEDEDINISEERLKKLNGGQESWPHSLRVFGDLLHRTPYLPYCVIHGLNDLESSKAGSMGASWCDEFLNILFERQKRTYSVFNVLFTTSGQSRILSRRIRLENRHITTRPARQVQRGGKRIKLSTPERLD